MPGFYKVIVTLLVIVAALAAHVFRDAIGLGASAFHLAGLVAIMVAGLWMFPEPRKERRPGR